MKTQTFFKANKAFCWATLIFTFINIAFFQVAAQNTYFDFGTIISYLPGNQSYGVDNYILPFSKNNGDVLCIYRDAFDYPMQYYNYATINSNFQSCSDPMPVFDNQRNGYPVGYMNENYVYIVSQYQTGGMDNLLFTKYITNEDTVAYIGEKSWFPTGAFSDNNLISLYEAPNKKLYLLNRWRYVGWSTPKEDLYISHSSDTMQTWSNWIEGGHINAEGVISSCSVVADSISNLYICLNTTWGGDNVVFYLFDPVQELFTNKINIAHGFGGAIYLNHNTGKLAICYISQGMPTVEYSHISNPAIWSQPVIIDPTLNNAIHGFGNTGNGGLFDKDNYLYLWTSLTEQYLFEWDGNTNWIKKGPIEKSLSENYYPSNKVLSDPFGKPIIFQCYENANSELFVHVKGYDGNTGIHENFSSNNQLFEIYPNPTTGRFTLELLTEQINEPATVKIYDRIGSMFMEKEILGRSKHEFDLYNQINGMYFVRVIQSGSSGIKKIIKD